MCVEWAGGGLVCELGVVRRVAVALDPYDDTINEGDIRQLGGACDAPQLAVAVLRGERRGEEEEEVGGGGGGEGKAGFTYDALHQLRWMTR